MQKIKESDTIAIKTIINVTRERIADMLCAALDTGCGGSWYWIDVYKKTLPTERPAKPIYWHDTPLYGGRIEFKPIEDDKWYVLNHASIEKGLQLMADKYPKLHWNNFVKENDDAETADVFLQLCLFSEVVYG